jgi:hypothetical protein
MQTNVSQISNDADQKTLREVFDTLKHDYPEAAVIVAESLVSQSPEDWIRENADEMNDLRLIKQVRRRFDIRLKEAKRLRKVLEKEAVDVAMDAAFQKEEDAD